MLSKSQTYAVIGASNDPKKYGHKVLVDLHQAGYNVIPINPKGGEIDGLKVYPDIASLPKIPDVVIFVVPPLVGVSILPEVKKAGVKKLWFQPGSESQEAIDYCRANNLECVANACIMIEKNKL